MSQKLGYTIKIFKMAAINVSISDFIQRNKYIISRWQFGGRNPTLFPIDLWNIFHFVPQGLPRKPNLVEGWHRRFLTTCGCHHPTIWKLIEALKTEEASVELKHVRFISGENPKREKSQLKMKRP